MTTTTTREPTTKRGVVLGACYRDPQDGEIVRVVETDPDLRIVTVKAPDGIFEADEIGRWTQGASSIWYVRDRFAEVYSERVPDPTPAAIVAAAFIAAPSAETLLQLADMHEARAPGAAWGRIADDGDHKPRGEKPPMALIPWEVVPDAWAPDVVRESLDPARVIAVLLETQGDALLEDVARAFGHGAAKYGVDNWRAAEWTDAARLEYQSAMLRHLYADAIGETHDPDSGLPHLAHACASAMIYTWHETRADRAEGRS